MSCDEARRLIDEDPAAAGSHVASCASCREYRERTEALDDALRALPLPRLGPKYWEDYSQRLRRRLPRARRPWLWIPLAAAAGLLLLLSPKPVPKRPAPPLMAKKAEPAPTPLTRFTAAFDRAVAGTPSDELDTLARSHWPHLVLKAASEDRRIAFTALTLLERIRIPESVADLAKLLGRDSWRDDPILRALARMDLPSSRAVLRASLEDSTLQGTTVAACAELPSRTSVPLLLSSYPALLDEVRLQADAILKAHASVTRSLLLRVFPTADDETAATFAPLAAELALRETASRLIRLAHVPEHRFVALKALTAIGTPEMLRFLLDLPPSEVLEFARGQGKRAVALLRGLASDRDRGAVRLLAELGESRALLEAYPRSGIKNEIVAELGRLHPPEILDSLLRIAGDGRVSAQILSEALSGYPAKDVVPRLIRNLEDPFSRPRAHEILKRLTGERLAPSTGAWEQWWKKQKTG